MSKELLKRVRDTLHELEETLHDLYWDIQTALEQNGQESDYAWPAVADYEKDVGFEVDHAFKVAWDMARTRLSNESTTQPSLAQAEEDLKRLEKRCPLRCDFSQAMKDLKREPPITSREMYQRGYAAAERDLKREPLSDEEINAINLPEKQCTLRQLVRLIEKAHGITGEIK